MRVVLLYIASIEEIGASSRRKILLHTGLESITSSLVRELEFTLFFAERANRVQIQQKLH